MEWKAQLLQLGEVNSVIYTTGEHDSLPCRRSCIDPIRAEVLDDAVLDRSAVLDLTNVSHWSRERRAEDALSFCATTEALSVPLTQVLSEQRQRWCFSVAPHLCE